eukprot:8282327-Pyramimonas_sp.AAC.1
MRCSLRCAVHSAELEVVIPLLAHTSQPPTRNLFGNIYDAGDGGATDDDIDDNILTADARRRESMAK